MNLTVNQQARSYDGDPEMPLMWYLRDELALTGTKFGCGIGVCGACTVHVDGKAVFSCLLPVKDMAGRSVTTTKGVLPYDHLALALGVMFLRDTVEQKLQGYSRQDTVEYYRKIVAKAWTQVEQAGTPELASNAYDQELLWLMLDPNRRARTETAFQNRPFTPNPPWFWWWYGYTVYHPHPIVQPNIAAPTESAKPPQMPGAEFANNIATAVEGTSNSIVKNLEQFANSIVPPSPKASHQPARKGSDTVCACAACACACACVSCACACAGFAVAPLRAPFAEGVGA